jgi:hypothetical protein
MDLDHDDAEDDLTVAGQGQTTSHIWKLGHDYMIRHRGTRSIVPAFACANSLVWSILASRSLSCEVVIYSQYKFCGVAGPYESFWVGFVMARLSHDARNMDRRFRDAFPWLVVSTRGI